MSHTVDDPWTSSKGRDRETDADLGLAPPPVLPPNPRPRVAGSILGAPLTANPEQPTSLLPE